MAEVLKIALSPTGSAGAATATVTSPVTFSGLLQAVYLQYTSMPGTTQVTLTVPGIDNYQLLQVTSNTDALYMPRYPTHDSAGTVDGGTAAFYVPNLTIKCVVTGADQVADGVIVYLVTI